MAKKILIIEDNESYLTILNEQFTHEDFDVMTATDGELGLQMAIEKAPDVILIDLLLPKMNGIEVMNEIRKNEVSNKVPLVILTNLNPDEDLLKSIDKNKPAYYLVKPQVTLEEIVSKTKEVLFPANAA